MVRRTQANTLHGGVDWALNQIGSSARLRVDALFLAVAPLDMRCGADTLLGRVVGVFGSVQRYTTYASRSLRARRVKIVNHDGFDLWLCAR